MIETTPLFDNLVCNYMALLYSSRSLKALSKYPVKSNIEDFYCSTKATKNSKIMLKSSQYLRKIASNFR
jgi:hypothetical protein